MIPDDEPWWMVRANTDNGCQGTDPWQATAKVQSPDILAAEPASETERALDSLDFRPIGYEW